MYLYSNRQTPWSLSKEPCIDGQKESYLCVAAAAASHADSCAALRHTTVGS